jgi:hypothetical protein
LASGSGSASSGWGRLKSGRWGGCEGWSDSQPVLLFRPVEVEEARQRHYDYLTRARLETPKLVPFTSDRPVREDDWGDCWVFTYVVETYNPRLPYQASCSPQKWNGTSNPAGCHRPNLATSGPAKATRTPAHRRTLARSRSGSLPAVHRWTGGLGQGSASDGGPRVPVPFS